MADGDPRHAQAVVAQPVPARDLIPNRANPTYTFWYLDVLAANLILFGIITVGEALWARGHGASGPAGRGFNRDLILLVLGLGVAVAQVKSGVWDGEVGHDSVGPFKWFWMLALGTLVIEADTLVRKGIVIALAAVAALAAYVEPLGLTDVFRYSGVFFFVSVCLLVSVERAPLPRWLHRPMTVVASSTLFIYLANVSVIKRLPVESWPGGWLLRLPLPSQSASGSPTCGTRWWPRRTTSCRLGGVHRRRRGARCPEGSTIGGERRGYLGP